MILHTSLVAAWCVVALGRLAPALGLTIRPWPIVGASTVLTTLIIRWLPVRGAPGHAADPRRTIRVAVGAIVVAAVGAYVAWLAGPAMYPIAAGPDLVHHLALLRFIQTRQTLPDDPIFGAYLGEMGLWCNWIRPARM